MVWIDPNHRGNRKLLMSNTDTSKPGSIGSYCVAIARLIDSYGLDARAIFSKAGLDLDAASQPGARLPVEKIAVVWRTAVAETENSALGLEIALFMEPTSFYSLSISTWASNTLLEALERYVRFTLVVSDGIELSLEEDGDFIDLQAVNRTPERAHEGFDACLSTILGICRQVSSPDFNPVQVEMERPEPRDADKFTAFFKAPVKFSADKTMMRFWAADLRKKLPHANEDLAKHNDNMSISYLAEHNKDRWGTRVYVKLLQLLPEGISTESRVADMLGVAEENLRRYLRKENTSYRRILNDTRKQLAIHYLNQKQLPLTEITYLLGFSDPSNFSRAFKQWTGYTPGEYRTR